MATHACARYPRRAHPGEVPEWLIGSVLKTEGPSRPVGSNPTLSARAPGDEGLKAGPRGVDHAEAPPMTGTRKLAIALLGLVFLLMWLAIVSNAQPIVPIPY